VQLAGAFACASLLAAGSFHGRPARDGGLAGTAKAPWLEASFRPRKRQQAARTPKAGRLAIGMTRRSLRVIGVPEEPFPILNYAF